MAGKREVDRPNVDSQQLLRDRARLLNNQSGGGKRPNSMALDLLTGRTTMPTGDDGAGADVVRDQPSADRFGPSTRSPAPRPPVRPRTVYLSDQDVEEIEFIRRAWRRQYRSRLSRSEVLRQAIGRLRDAVELGAAPRQAPTTGEENGTSG